jgi:hypothetical protein
MNGKQTMKKKKVNYVVATCDRYGLTEACSALNMTVMQWAGKKSMAF